MDDGKDGSLGSGDDREPERAAKPRPTKGALVVMAVALALVVVAAAAAWLGRGSIQPDEQFGQRVRAYLLEHPEVLVETVQRLEERERASGRDESKTLVADRSDEIFHDPDSPVGGNPEGDVTIVEFFDYNCPYCRRVAPVMIEAERDDPDLRIVYKEFPILGPNSVFAARAALASRKQGKYVVFHKALMQADGALTEDEVLKVAGSVGLDVAQLEEDMEDSAIKNAIDRNHELARGLRITGTPGLVVGDEIVRGATDLGTLKAYVRRARQSTPAPGQ